jgi:hypothetical protein
MDEEPDTSYDLRIVDADTILVDTDGRPIPDTAKQQTFAVHTRHPDHRWHINPLTSAFWDLGPIAASVAGLIVVDRSNQNIFHRYTLPQGPISAGTHTRLSYVPPTPPPAAKPAT